MKPEIILKKDELMSSTFNRMKPKILNILEAFSFL